MEFKVFSFDDVQFSFDDDRCTIATETFIIIMGDTCWLSSLQSFLLRETFRKKCSTSFPENDIFIAIFTAMIIFISDE